MISKFFLNVILYHIYIEIEMQIADWKWNCRLKCPRFLPYTLETGEINFKKIQEPANSVKFLGVLWSERYVKICPLK